MRKQPLDLRDDGADAAEFTLQIPRALRQRRTTRFP